VIRRALLGAVVAAAVLAGAPVAPAQADPEVMVVGRDGVLERAQTVIARAREVRVGRRRCRVGGRTPLAVLAGTGLDLRTTDQGACGRRTRDAGGLFVTSVAGQRNRGNDGWFYKVGRRAGTTGAGSPEGPFGDGRPVRDGQQVLWFYCRADAEGGCQRTLEVRADTYTPAAGATLRVTVMAYDNDGRGVPATGATVRLSGASAAAGPDGVASLTVPPGSLGDRRLTATANGMIDAFPKDVVVK